MSTSLWFYPFTCSICLVILGFFNQIFCHLPQWRNALVVAIPAESPVSQCLPAPGCSELWRRCSFKFEMMFPCLARPLPGSRLVLLRDQRKILPGGAGTGWRWTSQHNWQIIVDAPKLRIIHHQFISQDGFSIKGCVLSWSQSVAARIVNFPPWNI